MIRIVILKKVLQKLKPHNSQSNPDVQYSCIFSSTTPTIIPKLEKELKYLSDQQNLQRKYDRIALFNLRQPQTKANYLDELKYVSADSRDILDAATTSSPSVSISKSEDEEQINDYKAELSLYKQRVAVLETAVVYLRRQSEVTNLKLMDTQKQLIDSLEQKQPLALPYSYGNHPSNLTTILPFSVTVTSDTELQQSLSALDIPINNSVLSVDSIEFDASAATMTDTETAILNICHIVDEPTCNQPKDILKVSEVQDVKTETESTSLLWPSSPPASVSLQQQTARTSSVIITSSNQPSVKATVAVIAETIATIITSIKLTISHIFNSINNILIRGICRSSNLLTAY